jgi:hypothetical protein
MKKLIYSININAPKDKVWDTMLNLDTYKQWAKAFSPESQYRGEWKEGEHINFIDPNMGGTRALLEECKPHERIQARHVALVGKDGGLETESDMAKKWIGARETYSFDQEDGGTVLNVTVNTHEDFEGMFNDGWPKALDTLKILCEN